MNPVIFGEVLFDCFASGERVLGGAPFNVAWHLAAFGADPLLVSCVGYDDEGQAILARMEQWQMQRAGVQITDVAPTGSVQVSIVDREPHYDIVKPAAWDLIDARRLPVLTGVPFIYHGTLALRDVISRQAFRRLQQETAAPLFMDVNLRDPWWQPETVWPLLEQASWIKLNADELQQLLADVMTETARIEHFLRLPRLQQLLLTKGAAGAELYQPDGECLRVAPQHSAAAFVDAVGAGDAFTSVVLLGMLRGWASELTLQRAQAFASAIVGIRGATTEQQAFYHHFRTEWGV